MTSPATHSVYGGDHTLHPAANLADPTAGVFWHSAEETPGSQTYRQD